MQDTAKAGRYGGVARALHWTTAALIVVLLVLGLGLASRRFDEPEAVKLALFTAHESTGFTIFLLTLVRAWWRYRHPPPPLPNDMPALMKLGAHLSHAALYGLLMVLPVFGFLATNAWGFPLHLWWLIELPNPVGTDEKLAATLQLIHGWLAWGLAALLCVHIGAALFHQYWRRDGVLDRML